MTIIVMMLVSLFVPVSWGIQLLTATPSGRSPFEFISLVSVGLHADQEDMNGWKAWNLPKYRMH